MDEPDKIAQLLLEALPLTRDGFAVYDHNDQLIYNNEAWASLFDLEPDTACGLTFSQLIRHSYDHHTGPKPSGQDLQQWLQAALKSRRRSAFRSLEVELLDGRWLMLTEQVFNDRHLLCYCTDITEKKQLEKQLKTAVQRLHHLASQDDLTSLDNRRHFHDTASHEIERCHRHGVNATLLMIDIDHFKQVNDRFGHAAGDQVLRVFGGALKGFLRRYDLSGRMGGEEFAALLPETSLAQARLTAERLRQMTEALCIDYLGNSIQISISIGIATLDQHGDKLDELLCVADKYLYLAKEAGRNQVVAGLPSGFKAAVAFEATAP